jgi:REP element-mobilizing transposase RayT
MTRGNEKKDIFRNDHDRRRYVATLARYKRQLEFNLYCYVLMPNHTHLLLETPLGNIARVMLCVNTSYTAYFNKKHDRVGHLFQGRYKSALVDKENYLLELIRYIHLNPVRSGMVERADDYAWSSHRKFLSGEDRTGLLSVESVLSHFGSTTSESIREYRAFINSGLPGDNIEVREQQFIGDDVFIERVSAQATPEKKQPAGSRPSRQRARLGDILRTASEISGLREEEIRFSRGQNATRTRHVVIWLARRLSGCTLGEIGSYFGNIRWQTVANAVGTVDRSQPLRRMADDFLIKLEG